MRNSYAFIKTRRNKIYKLLKQHGSIKVKDLAEQLNTSPLTIRRDLEHLEEQGLIERFMEGQLYARIRSKQILWVWI